MTRPAPVPGPGSLSLRILGPLSLVSLLAVVGWLAWQLAPLLLGDLRAMLEGLQ